MRTPKKYSDLLKRKELTNAIIAECMRLNTKKNGLKVYLV